MCEVVEVSVSAGGGQCVRWRRTVCQMDEQVSVSIASTLMRTKGQEEPDPRGGLMNLGFHAKCNGNPLKSFKQESTT